MENVRNILSIMLPTAVSIIFTNLIETINIGFAGHISDDPTLLSGVVLGTLYFYTFGLTVLQGFNSVIGTLVSHAYGQNDLSLCRKHLSHGRILAFLAFFPMATLMACSTYFFRVFGINNQYAD